MGYVVGGCHSFETPCCFVLYEFDMYVCMDMDSDTMRGYDGRKNRSCGEAVVQRGLYRELLLVEK